MLKIKNFSDYNRLVHIHRVTTNASGFKYTSQLNTTNLGIKCREIHSKRDNLFIVEVIHITVNSTYFTSELSVKYIINTRLVTHASLHYSHIDYIPLFHLALTELARHMIGCELRLD